MLIHFGTNNIFLRNTSCGEPKQGNLKSTKPNQVTCTRCIRFILKRQTYKSERTNVWLNRLREIESIQNNSQQENIENKIPHTK